MDLKNMKSVDKLFEKLDKKTARKIDNGGTRPKRAKKSTAKKKK